MLRLYLMQIILAGLLWLLCHHLHVPVDQCPLCGPLHYSPESRPSCSVSTGTSFHAHTMLIQSVKNNSCFQSSPKLLLYSLVSWGLSSLLTLLLLLLDTAPLLPPDSVWRPGVGTLECFITRLVANMTCDMTKDLGM